MITKTRDETQGQCDAELIEVKAKNESSKKIAQKMQEVSELKASTIQAIGEGEQKISKVMQSRRKYDYLEKKLDVIK